MDATINLFDHLLESGRRHHERGRHHDALHILTKLSNFQDMPVEVAEEVQARLGEINLKRRKFARARRHLTAALRHHPAEARYHHLMGLACQEEDRGDLDRAAKHYRRCLHLDGRHVNCLVDFGMLAIRRGQSKQGLAYLREAVALAPDEPTVTAKLVKGLRHLGKPDEAHAEIRAALFRNPRDPRFRRLWNEYQFRELRRKQSNERIERTVTELEEPILLPFVRPGEEPKTPRVRIHGATTVAPPHRPSAKRKSGQREAN